MAAKAADALGRLEQADGIAGFSAREAKKQLLEAQLATPGQAAGGDAAGPFGGTVIRDLDSDKDVAVQAVQLVGGKVLYKRGRTWYSFEVAKKDAKKIAKAKVVKRFSKEYFEMVEQAAPAEAQALSRQQAGEEMMLEVQGKTYRVK